MAWGKRIRQRLRRTRLVKVALQTPVDPVLLGRPSRRVVAGLVLVIASYPLAWPAVAAVAAVAAWMKEPKLLIGGPLVYGFSWVVFVAGLALIGSQSLRSGKAVGLLLVRKLAERFLAE